ncbi:MAG TPA: hypothetical protein VII38_17025 [Polyangia bacterium]
MSSPETIAVHRERAALYRAVGGRMVLARGFSRLSSRALLVLGAPLVASLAVVGAEQVIELTGWLLGAQLFDLFSDGELRRFAWLIALVIAAITVAGGAFARQRYHALFEASDALGKEPATSALDRAAARLTVTLAPHRHRLQVQVLSIAAIAAVLFGGLALSLRSAPDGSAWPPNWRAAIDSPRALYLLDGRPAPSRVLLSASCEDKAGALKWSACDEGGCRLRAFVPLRAGETVALTASRAASAALLLHQRDGAFSSGDSFGRRVAGAPLVPKKPLALTAPRAGWYAIDLTSPSGSPTPPLALCVALAPRATSAATSRPATY